jgi:hypothetical protein
MRKQSYRREKNTRLSDGYSVLFVISISVIALLGVMGVTDALVSAQRNAASQVYMNEASSAAENALQYALGTINVAANNGKLSSISSPIEIPPSIAGNATVTVTMTSITSLSANSTPIYSQQTNALAQSQDYRLLSAQAESGSYRHTINVVLGPVFPANPPGKTPQSPTNNYFNQALLSNQGMQISGVSIQFDPAYEASSAFSNASYGQIVATSNGSMQLTGSVTIDGSTNAPSYSVPSPNKDGISPITVNGNVTYTGASATPPANFTFDAGGTTPTPGANVLGDALNGGPQNLPGAISNTAAPTQQAPIQVQTVTSAGALTVVGTTPGSISTTVLPSAPGAVTSLGAVNLSGNDSLTLSPGQYVVSSISTSPTSVININMPPSSGPNVPAPVQIYVQGDSPNSPALQLQGNVNMTGSTSASNLQIYYSGSSPVQVVQPGTTFMGQIYAPNATVNINTAGGVFNGSVVANNLSLSGTGKYYYDPRTVASNAGASALPKGAAPGPGFINSPNSPPTQFSVLSWQEQTTGAQ